MRQAFLAHGPAAVAHLAANSEGKFRPHPIHPDCPSELGGSPLAGRALEPLSFDGRHLGALFPLLRPPIPEFTVLGVMKVDRTDINHLLAMTRSFASFRHALKIVARHVRDRLTHARGTRLVMGNALVGRVLYTLARHQGVTLAMNTTLAEFHRGIDGIDALTLRHGGDRRRLRVRGGLVLASGGFNRDPAFRAQLLPGIDLAWCPGAPVHTGLAQQLALGVGAHHAAGVLSPAYRAPVSMRTRVDDSLAVFPPFVLDRAKPGMLTVNAAGRRFVNESTSYHLFALAMQQPGPDVAAVHAFLVCDAEALRKYGIGMARPGGRGLAPFIADGYLTRADTLDELARRLGIDATNQRASVAPMNTMAQIGTDPQFHRGETACRQNIGDAAWPGPNPSLGPLGTAPFYAVRLHPGDIGAATGLAANVRAQVHGADGALHAVGDDTQSIMGGVCTAPGITIGPGLVFASIAASDALSRAATPALAKAA